VAEPPIIHAQPIYSTMWGLLTHHTASEPTIHRQWMNPYPASNHSIHRHLYQLWRRPELTLIYVCEWTDKCNFPTPDGARVLSRDYCIILLVNSVHRASPLYLYEYAVFQLTHPYNTRLWTYIIAGPLLRVNN
jgi:hypothetical protein